jgi:hypothetical protein
MYYCINRILWKFLSAIKSNHQVFDLIHFCLYFPLEFLLSQILLSLKSSKPFQPFLCGSNHLALLSNFRCTSSSLQHFLPSIVMFSFMFLRMEICFPFFSRSVLTVCYINNQNYYMFNTDHFQKM